jgi:hypothetical protein
MFGADDGDWAIYRKIVRIIFCINMRLLLRLFFSKIPGLRRQMKRTISPSYIPSRISSSRTIPPLELSRHTQRSHPSVRRSCPPSDRSTSMVMSKVCLLCPLLSFARFTDDMTTHSGRARIHLSIERWRVCETWFAPSMAGVDSAGLGEVLQTVLASFSQADRGRLVQVRATIFLQTTRR